jgi:AAA+ superfamily predicted ATPase
MELLEQQPPFDGVVSLPDALARERLDRLVGIDDQKTRLTKLLAVLVNPEGLRSWAKRHHPEGHALVDEVVRRPPLVVLAGDVGSGKTELAETVGDAVARQEGIPISLLPLSLSARGRGRVGEMTLLVSSAFEYAIVEGRRARNDGRGRRGGVVLLIDEADALAQSRAAEQMHHEDRAGVNALIRGIDRIAQQGLPVAVLMCTNRLNALDPAVRRRAADILTFHRPDDAMRRDILSLRLCPVGFTADQVETLVRLTGPMNGREYGFTFSDLLQRLIPAIVLDAYPDSAISSARALELAGRVEPTPPFEEPLR